MVSYRRSVKHVIGVRYALLIMQLASWLYVGPKTTEVMFERHRLERLEDKQYDDPSVSQFSPLPTISNTLTLVGVHGYGRRQQAIRPAARHYLDPEHDRVHLARWSRSRCQHVGMQISMYPYRTSRRHHALSSAARIRTRR